jgi:hypothetical protein
MPVVTEVLRDAQTLAEFSNLEPHQLEYFRHNYSDFAPQSWWDYSLTLQDLLLAGNLEHLGILINDPFWKREPFRPKDPSGGDTYAFRQQTTPRYLWRQNQSWLREAWKVHFEIKLLDTLKLVMSVFDPNKSSSKIFANLLEVPIGGPYYRGLSYLLEQKWRARFCQECKKRFVAGESRNKYCSESCSHLAHTKQKLENWNKPGGGRDQRAARMKKIRWAAKMKLARRQRQARR